MAGFGLLSDAKTKICVLIPWDGQDETIPMAPDMMTMPACIAMFVSRFLRSIAAANWSHVRHLIRMMRRRVP